MASRPPRPAGEQGIELRDQPPAGLLVRPSQANERQRIGAEQVGAIGAAQARPVDRVQGGQDPALQGGIGRRIGRLAMGLVPAADAAERHQGRDGLARVGLGQGLLPPSRRVLPLHGDPGGVADRPVPVSQVGPGRLDCIRVRVPVEALQSPAQVPLRKGLAGGGLARRVDLAAGVGHTVKGRLCSSAADGQIHRAVLRVDDHVGHRQRLAADELFHLGGVAGPLGPEVDGAELPEAPVADEEGVLILLREFRTIAERDPGGRTRSDVDDRAEAVDGGGGPLRRAVAESELRTADHVIDASGPVPGFADVPLHVRVVGEQLAVPVEGKVERVAESGRDQLPHLAIRVGARDPALGSQRVVHETGRDAGREVVLAPVERDARGIDLRQLGRVAADHVERLAVRREGDRVHAVLAPALDLAEQLDLVVAVVSVGVSCAIEAVGAPLVHHHIKAIEGVKQTVGAREAHPDRLRFDRVVAARGRRRQAIELAVLVGRDEPALRVDAQGHPRALGLPRHRIDQVELEPLGDPHISGGILGGRTEWLAADVLIPRGGQGRGEPSEQGKGDEHR